MTNSRKLKARIVLLGMTQESVASEMCISRSSFNRKINNSRGFSLNEANKLAEILGIPQANFGEYFFA